MINVRLVERPAFGVIGTKTWIGGQDNDLFGRFWTHCRQEGILALLERIGGSQPGAQTGGLTLGVSRVEQDPAKREFYYMIAVEVPEGSATAVPDGLESYQVTASQWAIFECRGQVPESIVKSEMYAFTQWLPASGFVHAPAPELEVYPDRSGGYCEFWLPICQTHSVSRGFSPLLRR